MELSRTGEPFAIDILNGVGLLACDLAQAGEFLLSMRRLAGSEGYAVMESGRRDFLHRNDAWGAPRPAGPLMRALKLRWDPANILNRDEFVSLR